MHIRKAIGRYLAVSRWIIPLAALLTLAFAPSAQASAAAGGHGARANPPVHAQCSGWSYTPPSQCGHPKQHQTRAPFYNNDDGCSGYNESGEMMCKATTHDFVGTHVVIRKGFWDGSNGFGHDKALYYHNLWLQPSLDTIHFGIIGGSASKEYYDVYHYNVNHEVDQYVWVVADNVDTSFQGVGTGDSHSVGEITGYCENGSETIENQCPDWVNHTL